MTRDLVGLAKFIDSRRDRPHDFNGNCCVGFVLAAQEAQFGTVPELRVSWHDQRTALRAIAAVGGIRAEADRVFTEIPPSLAQFGDIAGVADQELGFHLMLVEGHFLIAPGICGLERIERHHMVAAWTAGSIK